VSERLNQLRSLVCRLLICDGHVLIEDVPALAKQRRLRSGKRSIGCTFKRIQFTRPVAGDVTGVGLATDQAFSFRASPVIMAQVVLADEINRATPKTQSSPFWRQWKKVGSPLMAYPIICPEPFMVMAAQGIRLRGTFPLPEAHFAL